MCQFFIVPGNGQALLGMPDIDVLNIMNLNIKSIGTGPNCDSEKRASAEITQLQKI